RFRVPGYGTRRLSNSPWRAAVTLVVKRAVVWPAGFLRRPLKVDIANVHPGDQGHTERLNSAVEVLVIHGIFVMPHAGSWVSHFVTHKPNPVVAWIGFDLADGRPSPGHEGRLHLHRREKRWKAEIGWASINSKLTVGDIVVHVAFRRVSLTPRVLMRSDVLTFHKIGRSRVERRVQIADLNPDPVGYAVVVVAGMVIGNVV